MVELAIMNVHEPTAEVIELEAVEVIKVTELTPYDNTFIGKRIERDGRVTPYPKSVVWWRQRVARCPATIVAVCDYLREARTRNIILIRGAPADLSREKTRRWKAGGKRGNHGFDDTPTKLFCFDIDGALIAWRDDPEGAIRRIVAQLGEPWSTASFVWFFTSSHGLETETVGTEDDENKYKRWRGAIRDGVVHVRLVFLLARALGRDEAVALTHVVKAQSGLPLDPSISERVQPNYITRPYWDAHPDRDPLGDCPTIGWIRGACETVTVPDDIAHKARWAKAQGYDAVIANHPDALSAVLGIGSDGAVRSHMMAAIRHLLKINPPPDHISYIDHSLALADKLATMIAQHEEEIRKQLAAKGRQWGEVTGYLPGNMSDWACWLMERPGALNRKTVRLAREEREAATAQPSKQEIFDRVARTIEHAGDGVKLLIAPPGSRKSTAMRAAAVAYVTEHPGQSVVILVPRQKLGDEQVKALLKEHPNGAFTAALWRGRHRDDPEAPDPKHPGKFLPMCWRSEEAKELEAALVNVDKHLCKRGRGGRAVRCPHFEACGYQRQKRIKANIWMAAHEMMIHEIPKAFGRVGRVMIDETPIDAVMFGTDSSDAMTLELDALSIPPRRELSLFNRELMEEREALYAVLNRLKLPDDHHQGVPVGRETLREYMDLLLRETPLHRLMRALEAGKKLTAKLQAKLRKPTPICSRWLSDIHHKRMGRLEWRDKVEPNIRPDMSAKQVREQLALAVDNARIKKLVTMWSLLGAPGRVQLHRAKEGRVIRMVGLHKLTKGWYVPTLICDGTGDATLLQAIWPDLNCEVENDWQQLPRLASVRVFQCVDRAVSKYAVAVEGEGEELKRRQGAARRLYEAVLAKALEYGGEAVGVITYKSTRTWIEQNCFVPPWLKLFHHGDVTGTNVLQNVRALFVIGRPLASAEAVTRMTEALFGDYIAERSYRMKPKGGRIPIVPDAAGNNVVLVDVWEHPDPRAERVRRQVTEASLLQAVGRARAGLRGADDPLDIHLWTDVPLPELGPVEPVLWAELEGGLDALMMATGGVWLESVPHAAKAYPELFTAETLKKARHRARARSAEGNRRARRQGDAGARTLTEGTSSNRATIGNVPLLHLSYLHYQLPGQGRAPALAVSMLGFNETKAWLEARLGPLPHFVQLMPSTGFFGRGGAGQRDRPDGDRDGDAFAMDGAAANEALGRALNKNS
jgi:hypothetical protein